MSLFLLLSLVSGMLAMMIRTYGTGATHGGPHYYLHTHKFKTIFAGAKESLTPREYFEVKHFNPEEAQFRGEVNGYRMSLFLWDLKVLLPNINLGSMNDDHNVLSIYYSTPSHDELESLSIFK